MSRTIRRRNYERQNPNKSGSKIAGYYTEFNHYTDPRYRVPHGTTGLVEWREPTPQEKNQAYWKIHADQGKGYIKRPPRFVRQRVDGDLKRHDDAQLRRYLKDPDNYEPQFWVMKPIDWREWD